MTARHEPSTRNAWRHLAACRGMPTAVFFSDDPADVAAARAVCAGCAVRAACRAEALTTREPRGIWGGLTPSERSARLRATWDRRGPGPQAAVTDAQLSQLFETADPDQPALAQLLERHPVSRPTAYRYLTRALRLGLVEHRGRALFPIRR